VTTNTAERKRAGRKTDVERAEAKAQEARILHDLEQSSRRAKPLDAQRVWVRNTGLALGGVVLMTAALFSFPAVADGVGRWMSPPLPWLSAVVPGFLETFIVFFGVDALYNKSRASDTTITEEARKRRAQSANVALWWMLGLSGVAVVALAAHAVDAWEGHLDQWQAWVGIAFAGLAPLGVVLVTKRIMNMFFAQPGE
jgi:hypothetical protein